MQQLYAEAFKKDQLTLVISGKQHIIDIEIAETNHQKALGLMYRQHLAEQNGMLFTYDQPQELTMWMKNTFIPLDMIFIKAGGIVHRIEANTEPLSETIIASNGNVVAVLELAGGVARRLGLKKGDQVLHPLLE
ncbi:MAG: DUF192 domain-containing protein [Pseudomonadota bacterium]